MGAQVNRQVIRHEVIQGLEMKDLRTTPCFQTYEGGGKKYPAIFREARTPEY
jgi:hypothetical protein